VRNFGQWRKLDPAILSKKKMYMCTLKAQPCRKSFDIMRIMTVIMKKPWPMAVPAAAVIR